MYRKIFVAILVGLLGVSIVQASYTTPKDVVFTFGQYMSEWCNTDDFTYREKIEALCSGVKSCRVEDNIHADYQRKRGYMDYETYVLDSYLNMFQTLISSGVQFDISNIVVETQDKYPDGQMLTFITADIKVSGKINYSVKELFLVRDNKISGIYSFSSKYGLKHLHGRLITELNKYYKYFYQEGGVFIVECKDGHKGMIDYKGNVLIPPIWDDIIYCGGEFARGCNNIEQSECDEWYWAKYWGSGAEIDLGPIYDLRTGKETPFSDILGLGDLEQSKLFVNGIAIVQNSRTKNWGYLRENDLTYSDINYCIEGDAYYSAFFNDNGFAVIDLNGKRSLIDKNYKIKLQDNREYELKNVLYRNLVRVYSKSTGKYGAVNVNGDIVIPCEYDYMYMGGEGLIKVYVDGKYGFVNTNGKLVAPCIYDDSNYQVLYGTMINDFEDPHIFRNGYCLVGNSQIPNVKDKSYPSFAVIDKMGNIVLPFNYSYDDYPFGFSIKHRDDIGYYTIVTRKDGKNALISLKDGNLIKIEEEYWFNNLSVDNDGYIHFSDNGKGGVLNTKGEAIVALGYYDIIDEFSNGYATAGKIDINGVCKYGLVNSYGNLVIPCIYDKVDAFINGIAIVEKDGILGLADLYGNSYFVK